VPFRRIVNASPLILLSRIGRLDLLRIGDVEVVVPDVVLAEIGAHGVDDPTLCAVREARWLTILPSPPIPPTILAAGLDAGESAVLALASAEPDAEAILDDLAARQLARALGIHHLGTIGLVLLAKGTGALPAARPVLKQLRAAGLYVTESLFAHALMRAGER
jgi:predicted nucleic acid-binding protein